MGGAVETHNGTEFGSDPLCSRESVMTRVGRGFGVVRRNAEVHGFNGEQSAVQQSNGVIGGIR